MEQRSQERKEPSDIMEKLWMLGIEAESFDIRLEEIPPHLWEKGNNKESTAKSVLTGITTPLSKKSARCL